MQLDPIIWFSDREVDFIPKHFIRCNSVLTAASKKWVYNKSQGRFALSEFADHAGNLKVISKDQIVYFEDQRDAMLYELLWANSN